MTTDYRDFITRQSIETHIACTFIILLLLITTANKFTKKNRNIFLYPALGVEVVQTESLANNCEKSCGARRQINNNISIDIQKS